MSDAGHKKRKLALKATPRHPDFREHCAAAGRAVSLEVETAVKLRRGTLDDLRERYVAWMSDRLTGKGGTLSPLTVAGRTRGLPQAFDAEAPKGVRMGSLALDLGKAAFTPILDGFDARTGAAARRL